MQLTVRTADDFQQLWNDDRNFTIDPEYFTFDKIFPPAEEVVDILRKDKDARVQFLTDKLSDGEKDDLAEKVRTGSIEKVIDMPLSLAHFYLGNFYGPGQFLHDFQEKVMIPWRAFLSSLGFTWQRCYPILFISGKGCSSTYHMDTSHVLAWQISGTKTFNSFKNPDHYAPIDQCVNKRNNKALLSPPEHNREDVLTYRMDPGAILWNQLLTPHWVVAGDEVAMSLNISHGGVSYQGAFCPREVELRKRWEEHPDEAWLVDVWY